MITYLETTRGVAKIFLWKKNFFGGGGVIFVFFPKNPYNLKKLFHFFTQFTSLLRARRLNTDNWTKLYYECYHKSTTHPIIEFWFSLINILIVVLIKNKSIWYGHYNPQNVARKKSRGSKFVFSFQFSSFCTFC